MGYGVCGMGRGLGTNAQVTTQGGLGFRRGPIGGGFTPRVGRDYESNMAGCHWPTKLAFWASRWALSYILNFQGFEQ
ncbi:hypothetical protein Hanom_Chr05g00412971 [Helianthus anomalus]